MDTFATIQAPALSQLADAVLLPDSYRRIQQIKTSYDPDGVIISPHPV